MLPFLYKLWTDVGHEKCFMPSRLWVGVV